MKKSALNNIALIIGIIEITFIFYLKESKKSVSKPVSMNITTESISRIEKIENFNITDSLTIILKQFEGFVNSPYLCPAGHLTMGYGHRLYNAGSYPIDTISERFATVLLKSDINDLITEIQDIDLNLSKSELMALVCFSFNLGISTLKNSGIIERIEKNMPIGDILMRYVYYYKDDEVFFSSHLYKRRLKELTLFNKKSI